MMVRLFQFQFIRLKNQKLIILLPILLLIIGGTGILLGYIYYNDIGAESRMWLFSLYNSYTQFTYLFLIYILVSFFANDFKNGIYSFMNQLGFSIRKCVAGKAVLLFAITVIIMDLFFLITNFAVGNEDYYFLFLILLSVDLSLIFIVLFTLLLSLVIRKTMVATIVGYLLFVAMDVVNFVGFGLTNPADGNSISSITFQAMCGMEINHYSLKTLGLDYDKYSLILATVPTLVWIVIIFVAIMCLLKRENKLYEI